MSDSFNPQFPTELDDNFIPSRQEIQRILREEECLVEGKLVGIARNAEALMSVQNQIREKRLKGYYLIADGNKYDIDENGHIDDPTQGTLINNHALEVLKELSGNK